MKTIWISSNRSISTLKGVQTCHQWAVIFWKEYSYWEESISINTGVKIFTKPYENRHMLYLLSHMKIDTCCHPDFAVLFREHRQGESVSQFSRSVVRLFATPWTAARQASLSITNSRSLLKVMSTESLMPSNHLTLCRPLLLLPSILPSISVFSGESVLRIRWPKFLSFSFNISPSNENSRRYI